MEPLKPIAVSQVSSPLIILVALFWTHSNFLILFEMKRPELDTVWSSNGLTNPYTEVVPPTYSYSTVPSLNPRIVSPLSYSIIAPHIQLVIHHDLYILFRVIAFKDTVPCPYIL